MPVCEFVYMCVCIDDYTQCQEKMVRQKEHTHIKGVQDINLFNSLLLIKSLKISIDFYPEISMIMQT